MASDKIQLEINTVDAPRLAKALEKAAREDSPEGMIARGFQEQIARALHDAHR